MEKVNGGVNMKRVALALEPVDWPVCQGLFASDWDKADYYIETGYNFGIKYFAVNIKPLKNTKARRRGIAGLDWQGVKVGIEFVGDGEPSVFTKGVVYGKYADIEKYIGGAK
jgi:hypothetical protein